MPKWIEFIIKSLKENLFTPTSPDEFKFSSEKFNIIKTGFLIIIALAFYLDYFLISEMVNITNKYYNLESKIRIYETQCPDIKNNIVKNKQNASSDSSNN